jgi:nitroreductase
VIQKLLSRTSSGAFAEPGPDDAELRIIFEAALRAPDHGRLRPWRFILFRGDARHRLSGLYVDSLLRRDPAASAAEIEKARSKPLRSPVTIAVAARIVEGHKVPAIEQTLSAGAAAMNILNAVHALGYGAKWVTGENCYDPEFRAALGLAPADRIVGLIHIGTAKGGTVAVERPDPAEFVEEWQ